jgi:hypothetical protein
MEIEFRANKTENNSYFCTANVPGAVIKQGPDAVREWLFENRDKWDVLSQDFGETVDETLELLI